MLWRKEIHFLVHPEANKSQIKEAVEKMFEGTKVKSVNTMNMDGKNKTPWNGSWKNCKDQESYRSSDRRQQRYRNLRRTLIDSPCGTSATSEALLLMNPRHSDYREYTHQKREDKLKGEQIMGIKSL